MPLSETNNKQSKSIEDLIAQLDEPVKPNEVNCDSESNNESANNTRKVIKGKRTSNNNNNNTVNSPVTNVNSPNSFSKTPSFGQNSEPILSKNIIMSKKVFKLNLIKLLLIIHHSLFNILFNMFYFYFN